MGGYMRLQRCTLHIRAANISEKLKVERYGFGIRHNALEATFPMHVFLLVSAWLEIHV